VKFFKHFKSIALIELYKNQFDTEIKSFYNETSSWTFCGSIQEIKRRLNRNGGYTSDWKEFLQQFRSYVGEFNLNVF